MATGTARRRGLRALLGALVVATAVAVPLSLGSDPAAAGELETFDSCAELAAWEPAAELGGGDASVAREGEAAMDSAAPALAESDSSARDTGAGTGDTNVVVEGVDELDVIDRVDEGRALIAADGRLSLVDMLAGERLAELDVPFDARLTYDPDAEVVWVAGSGGDDGGGVGGGVEVSRVAVAADDLVPEGTWTAAGSLVDARRTGDRLHVVAVDHPSSYPGGGGGAVPFPDGPVPCDQVLHPIAPSGPGASLVVSLPAGGAVEPLNATEVVGSGPFVHVTDSAAYLATPLWDGDAPETSIHRFDLSTLDHTGSGRVEGTLLNQFSMSEHDGFLRLALTHQGGVVGLRGMTDVAVDGPVPGGAAPDGPPLNEVVVLDTEGDLDEVGRTERFGHPGETLHGIRFDGDVAYAVTFLTTDPFYVVDVADPGAPQVVGEVELPGFSAYLHPVADGLVAGFGPDENGRAAVKLFDVADPAEPRVVDSEVLGDDSPVVWDHHAFLGLGDGRFAVPANDWPTAQPVSCSPAAMEELRSRAEAIDREMARQSAATGPDTAVARDLARQMDEIGSDPCISPPLVADTTLVVAGTAAGSIDVEQRLTVSTPEPASRVLSVGDGWALLTGSRLLMLDPDGAIAAEVGLAG